MLNAILFYDDRGRWWQPGNYITKVIDQSSYVNIYNHGVTPEDVDILDSLDQMETIIDFILVIDSGKTHHKLHHHTNKIKKSGAKTAIWLSDTHMNWMERRRWIMEFKYDYVFVAQKNAVPWVINECKYQENQVIWLPHAADPDIFYPNSNIQKRYDCVSVGFMNPNRERIYPVINNCAIFVNKSTIWAWSACKAYNEAKIGINIPVVNDTLNMRTFEIGACRIPMLIGYLDGDDNGLSEYFINNQDLLAFPLSNVDLLKEALSQLLIDESFRNTVANNMYEKVLKNHTYKHRLDTMLHTMGYMELF